jgi:hypothetical protein
MTTFGEKKGKGTHLFLENGCVPFFSLFLGGRPPMTLEAFIEKHRKAFE